MPFEITVQAYNVILPSTIIDEGTSLSIISSTTWKYFGSSQLLFVTQILLAFNRGTNQPIIILPKFPINLVGNTIYIDMMVFKGPLDFNLLLGHDYTYVMGSIVSSLFHVICFSHEGGIVTIDQLSLIVPNLTPNQPSSLNGP